MCVVGTESLKRNGCVPTNKMSEDVDRNHTMTYRKMDTVKSVTDMCDGKAFSEGAHMFFF